MREASTPPHKKPDSLDLIPQERRSAADGIKALPGLELGAQHHDRCVDALGLLDDARSLIVPEQGVGDQHRLRRTVGDRSPDFVDPVGNGALGRDPEQDLVHQPDLPGKVQVAEQPVKDPLPDHLLHGAPPDPPGLDSDHPPGEVGGAGLHVIRKLVLHEPRARDDERAGDRGDGIKRPLEEHRPGAGLGTLAAPGRDGRHPLRAELAQPVDLRLPLLDAHDVNHAVCRGIDGPPEPLAVHRPPAFDDRDLEPGLDVQGVVRGEVHPALDDAGDPETVRVLVELHLLDPDPEPHRPLLDLLRPELIGRRLHAPERRRKDEIPRPDQVGEVPEVVERLRKEAYLAELLLYLPDFGLHGSTISEPPGGTNAATASVFRAFLSPFHSSSESFSLSARTTFFAVSFGSNCPGRSSTHTFARSVTAPGGPPMTATSGAIARPIAAPSETFLKYCRSPRTMKAPRATYSPDSAVLLTWSGRAA